MRNERNELIAPSRHLLMAMITGLLVANGAEDVRSQQIVCNGYTARDYPGIRLSETKNTVTVQWERYAETYSKTIEKRFGILMEGAVDTDDRSLGSHLLVRARVDGVQAIIFDNIIFYPACEAAD